MQLPFLVVHAAVVWKVILAAFVALALAVFFAVRYALVRAANRAAARELDTNDEGVIRGTLRGGTASTLYVVAKTGGSTRPAVHAGDLVIATADGDVVLDGEIRVVAGAHVAAKRRGLPAATPEPLARLVSPIATAVLHEVRTGDEVIAKGTLVQEATDRATGYRENATRRVLRGPIAIAARAPMTKLVRPSMFALAAVIGIAAFAGYKALSRCGEAWRDTCNAGTDLALTNGNACVMAHAMPGQQGALAMLLEALDRKAAPDEAALQERIALSRVLEECRVSLMRLQYLDRPELSLEEALRCDADDDRAVALAQLGRFAEAAAVRTRFDSSRSAVHGRLLALAGAWGEAAGYAEERANELRDQPAEADPDRRAAIAAQVVEWQCIGVLMSWYAGANDASAARIRELAAGPYGKKCLPELAEIATDAERAAILAASTDLATPWRVLQLERQLAGVGMIIDDDLPSVLLEGAGSPNMAYGPALWATRIAPPLPDTAPVDERFTDLTHRLAIAVWMRDFPAAHQLADRAIEFHHDFRNRAGYDAQFVSLFHPMIDLYTAKTPLVLPAPPFPDPMIEYHDPVDDALARVWTFMTTHLALRHGGALAPDAPVSPEMRAALTSAQRGDGEALAAAIVDDNFPHPLDLIAVLPLVTTHRAELVHALAWMRVQDQIIDYRFPFGTAQYYAERRAMFEVAGDAANAKRADEVLQRYAAAFHDYRRLVALALLD